MTEGNGQKVTNDVVRASLDDHENRLRNLERITNEMSVHMDELPKITEKLASIEKNQTRLDIKHVSLTMKLVGAGTLLTIVGSLIAISWQLTSITKAASGGG